MSLRKITFNTAFTSSATVLRMLTQLFVLPVLARYLSPEDYGIVAMAMPFVIFTLMFADAGVGMSLVRTPSEKTREWSTCFWLSVFLGAGLAAFLSLCAPAAAYLLSEPRLTAVIISLSLVIFLQAAATVPGARLQQEERFVAISGVEIAAMTVSFISAIAAAIAGMGVWALVIQQLSHYVAKILLIIPVSRYRPERYFRLGEVKEHLVFGRDVLGVNFVNFITGSLYSLVTGKILGAAPTGHYSMAGLFAGLPERLVGGPLQFVTYPYFSKVRDNRELMCGIFLFLTRILAILVLPGLAMIAVGNEAIFRVLLSEKWMSAGNLFMLLAPGAAFQAITGICGTVLLASGKTEIRMRISIESGLLRVLMLVSSVWFGIEWVAVTFSLGVILYLPRLLYLVMPEIGCKSADYAKAVMVPAIVAIICAFAYTEILSLFDPGDIAALVVSLFLALAGISASALIQLGSIKQETRLLSGFSQG